MSDYMIDYKLRLPHVCVGCDVKMRDDCLLYEPHVGCDVKMRDDCLLYEPYLGCDIKMRDDCLLYEPHLGSDLGSITLKCNRLHCNYFAFFMITLHYDYINFQM